MKTISIEYCTTPPKMENGIEKFPRPCYVA